PNMEVRVFNPFVRGRMRVTQLLGRFTELNRRMHNKLFVADGQLAVVGGRNLIDDYFGLGKEICYRDFDLLAMGPVVSQAEHAVDQYWSSQWAYPISSLVKPPSQAEADRELHRFSERVAADRANFPYALPHDRDTALAFLVQFRRKGIWCPAELVYDDPNSVANPAEAPPGRVWKKVNELAMQAQHEIVIENPYLLPEPKMPTVRALRERGVQLRMLTNSLGTADEVPLNAHYAKARPEMVDLGVELYELKPDAASRALYTTRPATSKARLGAARKGHGVRPQDGGHRIVQPRSALDEPGHRNGVHRAEPTAGGAGSRCLRPRLRARERLAHRRRRRRGLRRLDHPEPSAAARRAARSGQRVAALPPVDRADPAHRPLALRNRLHARGEIVILRALGFGVVGVRRFSPSATTGLLSAAAGPPRRSVGSPGGARGSLGLRCDLLGGCTAIDCAADHLVEDRGEEQPEDRDAEHPAEHRDAECEAHLGPGAGRRDQGDDAEDEGERRHDDRPQPGATGLDDRLVARLPLFLELLGELHDQDGVLGGEADQYDQTDLREDVVVRANRPDTGDGGQEAHGHDQDDGARQRPALVLAGQHHEDQERAEREHEDGGVAGEDLLERQLGPLEAQSRRKLGLGPRL